MPIPTVITDLSTTAASNSPQGSDVLTEGDNHIRALAAILRTTYDNFGGASLVYGSPRWTFTGGAGGNFVKFVGNSSATAYVGIFTGATQVGYIGDRNGVTGGTALDLAIRSDAAMVFAIGATDRLGIETDGRLYATGSHNNGTVTGTTKQYAASGTYTPTLTNGANVAVSTAYTCQWVRPIGNVVIVSGRFDIDPTAAGSTTTVLGVSLPIASNFAAASGAECGGIGSKLSATGYFEADTTNDRATYTFLSDGTANETHRWMFSYLIL